MKFEHLAPKWNMRLKRTVTLDIIDRLGSFNTCIMGEITEKLGLPVFKHLSRSGTTIIKIPQCKECWELGVHAYKTIKPRYNTTPSEAKQNINIFYSTIVPKIEKHMRGEHRIG